MGEIIKIDMKSAYPKTLKKLMASNCFDGGRIEVIDMKSAYPKALEKLALSSIYGKLAKE